VSVVRLPTPPPPPPPRMPRLRYWGVAMRGRIMSDYNREDLGPPDELGDRWLSPSWIGVRHRAACVLYGTDTATLYPDNDRT